MSCGIALAAALMLGDPVAQAAAPAPGAPASAPVSVAHEPLFADLVARAGALKAVVDGWIASDAAESRDFFAGAAFAVFRTQAAELAERNMQGRRVLQERGADDDLKCILRGIAEDIPVRIAALEAAPDAAERRVALDELAYLLNDNVEVITAPPGPAA